MKRHFLLAALLAAVSFSGCAPEGNPLAMILTGNAVVGGSSNCSFLGSGSLIRTTGSLDLLYANNYMFYPTVESKLGRASEISELTTEHGVLDPNGILLTGVRIWYEIEGLQGHWAGGDTVIPDEVYTPTSGYLPASGTITFGVEIIPREVVEAFDNDMAFDTLYSGGYLIAHVAVEGRTQDGRRMRSTEVAYPIEICRGCLLYWPVNDPSTCCDGLVTTDVTVCSPGQDEAVPCDIGCTLVEYDPRADAKKAMIMKQTTTLAETPDDGGGEEGDVVESDAAEEDTI